jgi:hypothetical protein
MRIQAMPPLALALLLRPSVAVQPHRRLLQWASTRRRRGQTWCKHVDVLRDRCVRALMRDGGGFKRRGGPRAGVGFGHSGTEGQRRAEGEGEEGSWIVSPSSPVPRLPPPALLPPIRGAVIAGPTVCGAAAEACEPLGSDGGDCSAPGGKEQWSGPFSSLRLLGRRRLSRDCLAAMVAIRRASALRCREEHVQQRQLSIVHAAVSVWLCGTATRPSSPSHRVRESGPQSEEESEGQWNRRTPLCVPATNAPCRKQIRKTQPRRRKQHRP